MAVITIDMQELRCRTSEDDMASSGDSCSAQKLLARGQALHEALRAWGGPGSARLLKLVRSELSFVNRLAGIPVLPPSCPALRSSNFDHVEAVFKVLRHPLVSGVSAVMQNFTVCEAEDLTGEGRTGSKEDVGCFAHVDIVCMLLGKPVWMVVSSRNPKYVNWFDAPKHGRGLKTRVLLLLSAACADPMIQPKSIILCFAGAVGEEVHRGLWDEFRASHIPVFCDRHVTEPSLESSIIDVGSAEFYPRDEWKLSEVEGGDWLDVEVTKDIFSEVEVLPDMVTYEVDVASFSEKAREIRCIPKVILDATGRTASGDKSSEAVDGIEVSRAHQEPYDNFPILSNQTGDVDGTPGPIRQADQGVINLDTTSLVALTSEMTNGAAQRLLLHKPEALEKLFPSMANFIREQALSELQRPLRPELEEVLAQHQPVMSQYVHKEFSSILSQIGGPKEKKRGQELLQRFGVVADMPSDRVMALPLTGKIKDRHKIVFGTGDSLNAPTLTANTGFVRAATQKGMAIAIVEHRPRALIGE